MSVISFTTTVIHFGFNFISLTFVNVTIIIIIVCS